MFNELNEFKNKKTWLFRGQRDQAWSLLPKAGREEYVSIYKLGWSEKAILDAWKRYAVQFLGHIPVDEWDWLTLAQHHGLATRLLDWTKNPLNAAFFAVNGNTNKDAAIFAFQIDQKDINIETKPFSVQDFSVYFPKGLSARVVSQRGIFTISNSPTTPLEDHLENRLHKLIISSSATRDIKETLDFFGINKLSIYQDLDRLSEYLNEYNASTDYETFISDEIVFG